MKHFISQIKKRNKRLKLDRYTKPNVFAADIIIDLDIQKLKANTAREVKHFIKEVDFVHMML